MASVLRNDAPPPPTRWRPFDAAAATYDDWFKTPLGAFADQVERQAIFKLLAPQAGELILDVGCGTGRYARELARRGARAIGVDPSRGMLAVARAARASGRGPQTAAQPDQSYIRAAGEALPFRSAAFDGVVTVTTLEFATDPNALLSEAVRVSRAGGRVVVGVLSRRGSWAARRRRSRSPLWANARFFTEDDLRAMLERYGSVQIRRALFVPPQLGWVPSPLMALVERLGATMARCWAAFIAARVDVGR
jgi:ubiquinone/menaquinone biosynthesis C-methylase UbiE